MAKPFLSDDKQILIGLLKLRRIYSPSSCALQVVKLEGGVTRCSTVDSGIGRYL